MIQWSDNTRGTQCSIIPFSPPLTSASALGWIRHHHLPQGTPHPLQGSSGEFPSWAISQNNLISKFTCTIQNLEGQQKCHRSEGSGNSTGLQQEPGDAQRHPVTCSADRTHILRANSWSSNKRTSVLGGFVTSSTEQLGDWTPGTNAPASCRGQAESQCQLCLTTPLTWIVHNTQPPPCSSRKYPKALNSSLEH